MAADTKGKPITFFIFLAHEIHGMTNQGKASSTYIGIRAAVIFHCCLAC